MKEWKSWILFLVAIGLFYSGWQTAGFIVIVAAILKNREQFSNREWGVEKEILRDSKTFEVEIPKEMEIQKDLISLYKKKNKFVRRYPQLADEYENIIQSFWQTVASEDMVNWKSHLRYIMTHWPTPSEKSPSSVDEALKNAQRMMDLWQETKREARI